MTENAVSFEQVHGWVANAEAFVNGDLAAKGAVSLVTLAATLAFAKWGWPALKAVAVGAVRAARATLAWLSPAPSDFLKTLSASLQTRQAAYSERDGKGDLVTPDYVHVLVNIDTAGAPSVLGLVYNNTDVWPMATECEKAKLSRAVRSCVAFTKERDRLAKREEVLRPKRAELPRLSNAAQSGGTPAGAAWARANGT